ncbi:MAG: MBL fold metallo-hydrolase [Clostridia bacterium]|nr:MBL fold metallo-hydrolase [Clostridia bacterium]
MKLTWLGQAGFLFEADGKRIVIDPYLSDNVKNFEPQNARRQPIDERFLALRPDVIVITHNHLDHLDKETLKHYLTPDCKALVLCPNGGYQELRKTYPDTQCNYVLFNAGTSWTEGAIRFRAVKAEHSDPCAIGVILTAEGKNYYVTGDTLYSEAVFESLPDEEIYAVMLPCNGRGNNMNMTDAARFASRTGARYAVPVHIGMFDDFTDETFTHPNKITPKIYEEIAFPQ